MPVNILDKIGQPITEGCFIAYGHALGRCAGLRIGKVIKVGIKTVTGYYGPVEHHYRITVHGVNDDWSGQPSKLCSKKGTLLFPDRIIVLSADLVPQSMKNLYTDQ